MLLCLGQFDTKNESVGWGAYPDIMGGGGGGGGAGRGGGGGGGLNGKK